ncbi:MAG: lamin tail domain-containing protein [Bacteroidetes bacterium]|nr:lamin tail domain-containing protein [Bacteroidota bacterium]
MQRLFILIFLLTVTVCNAQLSDDFSDGDFITPVLWSGSSADFIVNTTGQLQLNAANAGESWLSTPLTVTLNDTIEWRIRVKQPFSPSSSNYSKIYLLADQPDLSLPLNGFYLRLGEALSADAVELFSQTGTVSTSICRGPDGQLASSFDITLRVLRLPTGFWTIYTDDAAGTNYVFSASGQEPNLPVSGFFGVDCIYTSGNVQHFYFDDVYVGAFVHDYSPPTCTGISSVTQNEIRIGFSEAMDSASVFNINNYFVDGGIGNPSSVEKDTSISLGYVLHFQQNFQSGLTYHLQISNVSDLSANPLPSLSLSLSFFPLSELVEARTVLFSEVYFEMSSLSPLPNSEYVEIYNANDSAVSLHNWILSDGSSDASLPDIVLYPQDYAVIFPDQNATMFSGIHGAFGVSDFPGLNNDTGDSLSLKNDNGEIIDHFVFSDETYHDATKKNGGWSLERIDLSFRCEDENNWRVSDATQHGTPGVLNSVMGIYRDTIAPYILNVWPADSTHLDVEFSENIEEGIGVTSFSVSDSVGGPMLPDSIDSFSDSKFRLSFVNRFSLAKSKLQVHGKLSDCAGNNVDTTQEVEFGFPVEAVFGDLLINELLFDPYSNGVDFVELYNSSRKIIDLYHWTIKESDYEDDSSVKEEALVSNEHKLLFPNEYLVLSEDAEKVKPFYTCGNKNRFLNVKNMPDFNADEGSVVLMNSLGERIDGFQYSDKLHFALINDPKGVSLERLNSFSADTANAIWHSASSLSGFATPGLRNSQWIPESGMNGNITIEPNVFSPDNDGYDDVLSIRYQFQWENTILSVLIFDEYGRNVRKLVENQTASTDGILYWDGLTEEGTLPAPGRYLILIKSFDLDGRSNLTRKSCVIGYANGLSNH